MRMPPSFPEYRVAKAPNVNRWLAYSALITLLVCAATLLAKHASVNMALIGMAFGLSTSLVLWLVRLDYYQKSVLLAATWRRAVQKVENFWWREHCLPLALQDVLLIGPAGATAEDWQQLFNRELPQPKVRSEVGQEEKGKTLRIKSLFSGDQAAREAQLAKMLVQQWQQQRALSGAPAKINGCYWLGSAEAWQVFAEQVHAHWPKVQLPAPKAWQGEETLAQLAEQIHYGTARGGHYLVAGCCSLPVSSGSKLPAGEAACLLLVGAEGPVELTRGEVFDGTGSETLAQVCQRAQQQSQLASAPSACMLFAHPEIASSGWGSAQYPQEPYWGEQGAMQQLIVLALAALFAQTQQQPCGWLATDSQHTLALGVVKPYEKKS